MANVFEITTAAEDLKANDHGKASAVFTVTNGSTRPVRGIAKVKAMEKTQQEWLEVDGETERDFSVGGSQQYTVNFSKPMPVPAPGSQPGPVEKFPFRLDVSSAANPDEIFTEGPAVRVEVKPPPPPPVKKPFPWWILAIVGGVLILVLGVVLGVYLFGGRGEGGGETRVDFGGNWRNADVNTNGITRLQIQHTGNTIIVHGFGKCHPTDCDWGNAVGTVVNNPNANKGDTVVGKVTWNFGFAKTDLEIRPEGDRIKVKSDTVFNDPRAPQSFTYFFVKE